MSSSQYSHFHFAKETTVHHLQQEISESKPIYLPVDNTMMDQTSPQFAPLQLNDSFEIPSTPPQMPSHLQKEQRTRFVLRVAILIQRLEKVGSTKNRLSIKKIKQLIRYATHRNRLGDLRYTPLVDSIERCLKEMLGCEEWFSICVEAEQRHRVRMLSELIVSSTGLVGSHSANAILMGQHHPSAKSNFQATFFP